MSDILHQVEGGFGCSYLPSKGLDEELGITFNARLLSPIYVVSYSFLVCETPCRNLLVLAISALCELSLKMHPIADNLAFRTQDASMLILVPFIWRRFPICITEFVMHPLYKNLPCEPVLHPLCKNLHDISSKTTGCLFIIPR